MQVLIISEKTFNTSFDPSNEMERYQHLSLIDNNVYLWKNIYINNILIQWKLDISSNTIYEKNLIFILLDILLLVYNVFI